MKLLTLNFLTCARKTCKSAPAAFPLHPKDAELEQVDMDLNPVFLRNILPRLDWEAMRTLAGELGLPNLPLETPAPESLTTPSTSSTATSTETPADDTTATATAAAAAADEQPTQVLRDLHTLLMETSIASGRLACGNCGHEYAVKEGIANFLLPSHLV